MARMDSGAAGGKGRTRSKAAPAPRAERMDETGRYELKPGGEKLASPAGEVDAIRLRMLEVLQDREAPAAAVVAAAKTLQALGPAASGSPLGSMTRAQIREEINWCASQLGRNPLI